MSITITFDELEGRSHAILADASLTVVRVAKHTTLAFRHYRLHRDLSSISRKMEDFLLFLHAADFVKSVESADPADVMRAADTMREIPAKLKETLFKIRSTDMGYWLNVHRPYLDRLEVSNRELQSHIRAFSQQDSPLLLLSKGDQDKLVASLLDPPEPNDALKRAFGVK